MPVDPLVAHGSGVSIRPLALLLPFVVACAEAPPPEPATAKPAVSAAPAPVASAAPPRPVPPGHLRREDVMAVLSDGPPAFLSRVDVDAVRTKEGKFVGWRVKDLDPAWASGAVRPGDIVLRVNDDPLETPYTFFDVFQSLAFAKAVRIAVERDGKRVDVTYPIDDDPNAPALPRASGDPAPKKAPGSGS